MKGELGEDGRIDILLVEDNEINQAVILAFLEGSNLDVDVAINGLVAIEKLEDNQSGKSYQLILMDCQMPELDGFETTEIIRNSMSAPISELPIVAVTAHAFNGEEEKCREVGMSDFLIKPLDPFLLTARLSHWLGNRFVANDMYLYKNVHLEEGADSVALSPNAETNGVDASVWDREALLKKLRGKEARLTSLIDTSLPDLKTLFESISESVEAEDDAEIKRGAHTMKGVAANLGGIRLFECAEKFEGLESMAAEKVLFDMFEDEYHLLYQSLEAELLRASKP